MDPPVHADKHKLPVARSCRSSNLISAHLGARPHNMRKECQLHAPSITTYALTRSLRPTNETLESAANEGSSVSHNSRTSFSSCFPPPVWLGFGNGAITACSLSVGIIRRRLQSEGAASLYHGTRNWFGEQCMRGSY